MNTLEIANAISAKLIGPNNDFTGIFTVLGESKSGDIVNRHWINEKAIEIAKEKNLAGIITSDPRGRSCELAEELGVCLIILDKIEIANAFSLKWTINNFANKSKKVAITGTNGKSTVSHMIYHILNSINNDNDNDEWNNRKNIYTNTDAKSEFNTLIDPMISKQIANLDESPDYLVIEVSEVQGWLDKLMVNHAYLIADAIAPNVGIITNISLDHIGLVNSIDDVYNEVLGFAKSIDNSSNKNNNNNISNNGDNNNNNFFKTLVLNYDDKLVRKIANSINNSNVFFFSMCNDLNNNFSNFISYNNGNISYNNNVLISLDDLPFKSNHFIQNTLAAIAGAISLEVPIENIVSSLKTYNSLNRRFKIINKNPLIIDDFAHNPEGIKATINAAFRYLNTKQYINGSFFVVCSIRGSRGLKINQMNVKAIKDAFNSLNNFDNNKNSSNACFNKDNNSINSNKDNNGINNNFSTSSLIITNSSDFVDNLNVVTKEEEYVFLSALNDTEYFFYNKLDDAISNVLKLSNDNDVILLIGAQGMDPAEELLKSNYLI